MFALVEWCEILIGAIAQEKQKKNIIMVGGVTYGSVWLHVWIVLLILLAHTSLSPVKLCTNW